MIADFGAFVAVSVVFGLGAAVGWMLRGRHLTQPLIRARCIDSYGLCKAFRSQTCLDGRCRYHCSFQCKCFELTAQSRANKRWNMQ